MIGAAVWVWALGTSGNRLVVFPLICGAVVSAVLLTPDIGTAFFWFAAFIQYLPALIFMPVLLVISRSKNSLSPLLGLLVAFGLAGFNEQGALIIVVASAILFAHRKLNSRQIIGPLAILVGASIGLLVSALAPGNAVRIATVSGHLPPMRSIEIGFDAAQRVMQSVFPSFPLYFPTYLDLPGIILNWPGVTLFWLIIMAMVWGQRIKPAVAVNWRNLLLATAIGWGLCSLIVIATALAIKQPFNSYERTFFIPNFLAALTAISVGYALRSWSHRPPTPLVILLMISIPYILRTTSAVYQETITMQKFAVEWDRQDAKLKAMASAGVKNAHLKPLKPPFTVVMWSVKPDGFMNNDIAKHYGFNSITGEPTEVEPED